MDLQLQPTLSKMVMPQEFFFILFFSGMCCFVMNPYHQKRMTITQRKKAWYGRRRLGIVFLLISDRNDHRVPTAIANRVELENGALEASHFKEGFSPLLNLGRGRNVWLVYLILSSFFPSRSIRPLYSSSDLRHDHLCYPKRNLLRNLPALYTVARNIP